MSVGSITPGEQYGFRKTRQLGAPVQRVEVISKIKPGKWKIRFLDEPNAGLTDFVGTGNLVVGWAEAEPFIADELRLHKVVELSSEQWNGTADDPVAGAIDSTLNATGDWDGCLDGRGVGYVQVEAAKRIARRAKLDPDLLKLDPVAFVDRFDNLYLTFDTCLQLAQAFARAEPDTVLTYIDAGEREYLRRYGDDAYMVQRHAKHKAANHLAREWTNAPEGDRRVNFEIDELRREATTAVEKLSAKFSVIDRQKTEEIQRLRSLVLEASESLRSAGADDKADKLLLSLNRPVPPKR